MKVDSKSKSSCNLLTLQCITQQPVTVLDTLKFSTKPEKYSTQANCQTAQCYSSLASDPSSSHQLGRQTADFQMQQDCTKFSVPILKKIGIQAHHKAAQCPHNSSPSDVITRAWMVESGPVGEAADGRPAAAQRQVPPRPDLHQLDAEETAPSCAEAEAARTAGEVLRWCQHPSPMVPSSPEASPEFWCRRHPWLVAAGRTGEAGPEAVVQDPTAAVGTAAACGDRLLRPESPTGSPGEIGAAQSPSYDRLYAFPRQHRKYRLSSSCRC